MLELHKIVFCTVHIRPNCGRGYFSDDNAIRYVLPALWMTSRFSIMGEATATLHVPSDSPGGSIGGEAMMSTIAFVLPELGSWSW